MEKINHITQEEIAQYGVVASPDVLNDTAANNKAVFDRLVRELVAVAVNKVIDAANELMVTEGTRETQEAARVTAEEARLVAESLRVAADEARGTAEVARVEAERLRGLAETSRDGEETARKNAETARVEAEAARVTAEALRVLAEEARAAAENARALAETGRAGAEGARVTQETERAGAEALRVSGESGRVWAENLRVTTEAERVAGERARTAAEIVRGRAEVGRGEAEGLRVSTETERVIAEAQRGDNEVERVLGEELRVAGEDARNVWQDYDPAGAYVPGNKVCYQGSSFLCTAACTGVLPTVTTNWRLIAAKGVDGEGAGDMLEGVYDPTGKKRDVFAYADEVGANAKAASVPLTQKGAAGGVAPLGADTLVPVSYLPSQIKERLVVGTIAERDAVVGKFSGLSVYVKDATADPTVKAGGADYLWDGAAWIKTGEAESMDVVIKWENVTEKPGTFPPSGHSHTVSDVTGALKQFGPVNLTVPVSGWTGAGPWAQNVAVSGVLASWDWRLKLSLQKQTVTETRKAQEKAIGCVTYCDTYNGGVTLTCYEKKPEVSLLVTLSGEV